MLVVKTKLQQQLDLLPVWWMFFIFWFKWKGVSGSTGCIYVSWTVYQGSALIKRLQRLCRSVKGIHQNSAGPAARDQACSGWNTRSLLHQLRAARVTLRRGVQSREEKSRELWNAAEREQCSWTAAGFIRYTPSGNAKHSTGSGAVSANHFG